MKTNVKSTLKFVHQNFVSTLLEITLVDVLLDIMILVIHVKVFPFTLLSLLITKQLLYLFLDINECSIDQLRCGDNATCVNTNGSFYCACLPGYSNETSVNCTGTF